MGKRFPGFEEERWLDIRRLKTLKPIMRARFDRCAAKGFDAVEPLVEFRPLADREGRSTIQLQTRSGQRIGPGQYGRMC